MHVQRAVRLFLAFLFVLSAVPASAQIGIPPSSLAPPVIVFPASAVNGAGQFNVNLSDLGTHSITAGGEISAGTNFLASATGAFYWSGRSIIKSPSDGNVSFTNFAGTIGSQIKADALPTVSACGAGSPAVVAGSTPWYGSVTIGTTAVATCTITFNGTAYPSAPHCSGAVETTTPANVRAMGYSASTTVLTIVPASAWADSSIVNWNCGGSK